MSETKAGNIEAIRDWSKRYFYTKSDVSEFFTKLNTGLTAYKLTIIGPANTEITITDNDQTDPQEYVIETSSSGVYIGLFFFNAGNTISLSGGSAVATHVLSDYVDIIYMGTLSSLIPVMTSNTTPSGVASASTIGGSSEDAWKAMDGDDNSRWCSLRDQSSYNWIQYQFTSAKVVKKIEMISGGGNSDTGLTCTFTVKGSNDGNTFTDIETLNLLSTQDKVLTSYPLGNSNAYSYYRVQFNGHNFKNNYNEYYNGLHTLQLYEIITS